MIWTDEQITLLREFWASGMATAEIGRRLGVSKGAAVGKAHRLELDARPSPIKGRRDYAPRLPSAAPAGLVTLAPLSSLAGPVAVVPASAPKLSPVRLVHPVQTSRPAAPPRVVPVHVTPAPVAVRAGPRVPCCWPIGEPGTKGFHFCEVKSVAGRPYCDEHCAKAYVKIRDRAEAAA